MLRLVRSLKNSFAPINRIPPEVLSTIPDYYLEDGTDRTLIALTHVCRGWRDAFVSRSSLWSSLDFTNVDKTLTYIQRSQSSPLNIRLGLREAIDVDFAPITPHVRRLKSLTIKAHALPTVLTSFRFHTPPLEKLCINIIAPREPVLDSTLFNKGYLPSLRELRLGGVVMGFPWKNLANLQIFDFQSRFDGYSTTQILDFFESAPLLHTVSLRYPMPSLSNAAPGRIVPLHHLKVFTIDTDPLHSILLRHLHIPIGASLVSRFSFRGVESPFLDYLPDRSANFSNLSHITTINLLFNPGRGFVLLSGPSGSLRMIAEWARRGDPSLDTKPHQILRSLGHLTISTVQRLTIFAYSHSRPAKAEECPIFQTLSSMNDLRTLVMIDCNNRPFTCALDPQKNPSSLILCSKMEELVLYIKIWDVFDIRFLIKMAKNRASRGAKLSLIRFVDRRGRGLREEALKLGEHVTHVEYRVDDTLPAWDDIPGCKF